MQKQRSFKDVNRKGYSNLKTAIKHNITTKLRSEKSGYLEMFIMDKHRSRLIQERANLARRVGQIDAELARIQAQLAEKKTEVEKDLSDISPDKTDQAHRFKTMSLEY